MGSSKGASEVIALLGLKPHADGGFYLENFRDFSVTLSKSQLPTRYKVDRPVSSSIYFLLSSGSMAHLHRIPCAETFHFYMGEPLTVFELSNDGVIKLTVVGPDLEAGQQPQHTVSPNVWFGAFPTNDILSYSFDGSLPFQNLKQDPEKHYSLVGVTCAPAFQFEDNERATPAKLIAIAPNAEPFIRYLTLDN